MIGSSPDHPALSQEIPEASAEEAAAAVIPVARARHEVRYNGVFLDVQECLEEVSHALDHPGEESSPPNVTIYAQYLVVCHRKYAQNPLQNSGKAFSRSRSDYHVEVVTEDAEIVDGEPITLFGSADGIEEELLHGRGVHEEFLAIGPGSNMVGGAFQKDAVAAHMVV